MESAFIDEHAKQWVENLIQEIENPKPKEEEMALPRPCARCGKRFQPNSSSNKLCEECWKGALRKKAQKKKEEPKRKMNTLEKFLKRWRGEKN